jgi:iron complex outermembrane recepter protein
MASQSGEQPHSISRLELSRQLVARHPLTTLCTAIASRRHCQRMNDRSSSPAAGMLRHLLRAAPLRLCPCQYHLFHQHPMNAFKKIPIVLVFGWLALVLASGQRLSAAASPTSGSAAQAGAITGRVQNVRTAAHLEGAVVTLDPTRQTTLTERDGSYRFTHVPPGVYRVSVSYTGLDPQTHPVLVTEGGSVTQDFALTSEIYALEAFTVAGEREGNALAITQQRNAPNVKNVISADAFGNIADQNIGNLLMRLPGIVEEVLEGEVANISIRGVSADMNAVTVDGTRGASGGTGTMNRAFAIDRIPADFVERIEVTKAITPDMDADSIGGAVNLRTRSPLDRKGRAIAYMGGTSWNLDQNSLRPIASFSYSDILGAGERIGVLLTSSFNRTHKPRDSIYKNFQATTASPAYFWMSNLGEDGLTHQRIGVGARVDYKLSHTHRVFVNTMYSDYKDTLDRRHIVMSPTAAQIRPGYTETVTETFNHPITLSQNHRVRTVKGVNTVFGGNKRFASSVLDYGANYSRSAGTEDRIIPQFQMTGMGFRFDRSASRKYPTMTQISGPSLLDRSEHRNTTFNLQDFDDKDIIQGMHVNWRRMFAVDTPASIKTGVRYRGQKRTRDQSRPYYVYTGPDGVAGRNPATGINDDNVAQFADSGYQYRAAGGRYDPVPVVDPYAMMRHLRANPGHFTFNVANSTRDELQFDGRISEDVYAAYIMGDVRLGRLDILAGVRVEETRLSGRGVRQEITPEERARRAAWVGPVTPEETRRRTIAEWSNLREEDGEYRNVLPSVHFKYQVMRDMISRLSYSTGIGRPNFSNLLRTTTVNNEAMTIVAANPNLRPQRANNFDFSLEYYFEPAGFLSGGMFLKEIKDFIYGNNRDVVGSGPNNGFDGQYEGYQITMQANGGFARVRGFELAYNQRYTFLPGVWKGLGFMANFTKMDTKGEYSPGGGIVTQAQLAGFTPRTFNTGLSYTYRKFDAQVKLVYRAKTLGTFNANPAAQLWRFPRKNVDLSFKYNWRPWMSFYADVINVFNGSLQDNFIFVRDRVRQTQIYSTSVKAGVSGRF